MLPPTGEVFVGDTFRPAADATVSVFDHGLLYGDGIFEGIRAYSGLVFKLDRHVDRLFDSARAIRLDMPYSRSEVAALVLEACRRNAIVDGYVRLVVTRGPGDLTLDPRSCARGVMTIIARPAAALARHRDARKPAIVVTSSFRRPAADALCPSIKSLNYLNNVLARIEANDRGADEALLLDSSGYVAEGTADNIFIVTDRGLATPPTISTLKGITRETMFEIASEIGLAREERLLTLYDVWTAREVFLCGTFAEIVPVGTVDGRAIGNGAPGPTTMRVMAAYERIVRSMGTPIDQAMAGSTTVGYRV